MSSTDTLSRIDTSVDREASPFDDDYLEASPLRAFPTKLSGLGLPSVRLSNSPIADEPSSTYESQPIPTNVRARNESRKLLSHVLRQLAQRKKPPPIKDMVWNGNNNTNIRGFGMVAGTLKDFVNLMPDKRVGIQNDSDDEENRDFSTDETFDLMLQLEDVLTMSIAQGWRIFDDGILFRGDLDDANPTFSSTFRRSRSSFRSGGKHSQPLLQFKDDVHVPELLFLCVSILASVIAEDCRYKIALPRPSRPPYALQVLTLNVAQFLIHVHRHDPRVISHIAFVVLPAFSTFPPQMHTRLLYFFETSIVRPVLQDLGRLQGLSVKENIPEGRNVDPFNSVDQYEGATVSIHIDEVRLEGEVSPQHNGSFSTSSIHGGVQSSNHPRQTPHIYYLAFLVPPLLSVILDSIETNREFNQSSENVLGLDNLLTTISGSKIDTYNDLLEIIAYHCPRSRRLAISFMAKFWPRATGHTSISRPFCAPLQPYFQLSKYSHAHQFVPWHFNVNEVRFHVNVASHMDCRSCTNPLGGFALICPLCMCAVHFECYDCPEGNYQIQYSMTKDPVVQRIAMYRFSDLGIDTVAGHTAISERHDFRPVNWFTLCLCYACQKPLWGCMAQGLRCRWCSISVHFGCLTLGHSHPCKTTNFTSMHMTISREDMRNSCLAHFSPVLCLTQDQLNRCSREEVSIYHTVFRTQLQLLTNGIAMGSIIVTENATDTLHNPSREVAEFELSKFTTWCDQLLDSNRLSCSPLTQQFLQDNTVRRGDDSLMYEWSYLEYISSNLKISLPQGQNMRTASEFLNISRAINTDNDTTAYSYECISVSHMRDILGIDFAVQSDHAARFILDHLHHLSFFDRVDRELRPFNDLSREKDVRCMFPLPYGLDISTNVETLVSSVEACLTDLDLSSNEFGFLLLTRRLRPNRLASEYGLKRLAGRVLGWILKEDDSLATILREFVARKRQLPGVRSDKEILPWPSLSDLRPGITSLSSNGGDYVTARHSLLSRFAAPWLLELHDIDSLLYGQIVFDTCSEVTADQNAGTNEVYTLNTTRNTKLSRHCEGLLRSIFKLCHTSVIFSIFDSVFIRWMGLASQLEQLVPSLQRFFGNESESSQRLSSSTDGTLLTSDKPRLSSIDPFHAILSLAGQSEDGLSRSLFYLSMLTKYGTNVPTSFFMQFSKLIDFNGPNSLDNANTLLKVILLCLWQTSIGKQELQNLVAMLHSRLANQVLECLLSGKGASVALSMIRYSFAACLRIYGCERSSIRDAGIIEVAEVQQLPSRRKLSVQRPFAMDPMIIDARIMASLELYLRSDVEEVSSLTVKFLNAFLTESPFLEVFEADNFILRNGKVLASCIWISYGVQQEDVAIVRTNLLLRNLIVDSDPFQDILLSCFNYITSPSQQRLSGVNRLFRMISDVTSPAFNVEGRQWRSSVIDIFYHYFTALWADPTEEVRLAVQSSSAALLPAHLEAISQCWIESLSKAPIAERVRLISFLIQLRPHFPNWKVLSWDVIVETLMEYDDDTQGNGIRSSIGRHETGYGAPIADSDVTPLRVSILLLSLQMIGDGIEIDGFSLMKLNFQYLKITGFSEVSIIPAQNGYSFHMEFGDIIDVPGSAFPCVEELVHVIDAAHFVELPHLALGFDEEQEEKTSRVLIGTIFIESCLSMISNLPNLTSLPVLTLKSILETLYILVHKYDFEDNLLRYLQPSLRRSVLRTVELLSQDISYELRQLLLSIAQVSIKKWHGLFGSTVSDILELVAAEIASQNQNSQDSLVLQCKLLIVNTLQSFANSGLLFTLMKRSLKRAFFVVLREALPGEETHLASDSLCDILLRDTLSRTVDCDSASFQTAVININNFIEIVHPRRYGTDMMIFTGRHLTNLVRRMSDGTIDGADASPLVSIAIILVQNNKRNSKDLLPYIDIVLRVALNRLHIDASCLAKLILVTTLHHSKAQESTQGGIDVVSILLDILWDGFRMKTKMAPSTIKTLVEVLMPTENGPLAMPPPLMQRNLLSNLADDAFSYLQNHPWHDDLIENDFGAVIAAGKLVLQAAQNNPTIFQKFADHTLDKPSRYSCGIRSWNILLLASFQEVHDEWRLLLYSHFLTFTNAYSTLVRGYVQAGITSMETATSDVNQLHISMKLWLMLVQFLSPLAVSGEAQIYTVWNELWSAHESLLGVLEMEAQAGLYPTLISLASTSIADILMYMRSLRSPLALDTSTHVTILGRLRALNRGDSTSNKVVRAIRFMCEVAPEVASRVLLDQIVKELMAAEKMRVVETRRDHGRMTTGDRFRKEMRLPTV